jgi:hypothetical protein
MNPFPTDAAALFLMASLFFLMTNDVNKHAQHAAAAAVGESPVSELARQQTFSFSQGRPGYESTNAENQPS